MTRRMVQLILVIVFLVGNVSALAESSAPLKILSGTVQWTIDTEQDYAMGTVFVKGNDGSIEITSFDELYECYENNEVRFNSLYKGAEMIFIDEVKSINGPVEYNGHMMANGYVETSTSAQTLGIPYSAIVQTTSTDIVINLNKGDIVVCSGRLWNLFGHTFSFYCANGYNTTIETYDDYVERISSTDTGENTMDVVGASVFYGSYEQDGDASNGVEPIEWIVLAVDGDKSLLISRDALDVIPYDDANKNPTWEKCSLRAWLNNDFLESAFSEDEQKHIQFTEVSNKGLASNSNMEGSFDGNDTTDRIFCLSADEADAYFVDDGSRICSATTYSVEKGINLPAKSSENITDGGLFEGGARWWLRTPGHKTWHNSYYGMFVDDDGYIVKGWLLRLNNSEVGIRPVFWYTKEEVQRQYPLLKKGSKGDDVVLLQQKLIEYGALSGSADGDYGNMTANAVKEIQKQFDMEPTGVADNEFQQRLFSGN